MDNHNNKEEHHITSYFTYVIVWVGLLALTSITVTIAGISLGQYTLIVAMFIAAVKSYLVINIFMHIKFDQPIFKIFLLLSGLTLLVIFILTGCLTEITLLMRKKQVIKHLFHPLSVFLLNIKTKQEWCLC